MKKKTKIKLIILILIVFVSLFLYFSGIYNDLKIKAINYFENTLEKKGLELIEGSGSLIDASKISGLKDSGITGEGYSFSFVDNPYYKILDDANDQKLYAQIYANIDKVEKSFKPVVNINKDSINDVVEAVFDDHPELFYVNTSYSYKYIEGGKVVQITLSYNSTAKNLDASKTKFNNKVNEIIAGANKYSTNYEKEKYVHDTLININTYDESEKLNQSAYSALITGRTVCAGYSRAFQLILNKMGITTYYITGDSSGDHAWNVVELDGDLYNVDVTWDDQEKISYRYFDVPDSVFSKTHIRKGLSIYISACRGTKYYNLEEKNTTTTNKRVVEDTTTKKEEEIIVPSNEKEEEQDEIDNTNNNESTDDKDTFNRFYNYYRDYYNQYDNIDNNYSDE